ncbi:MAG: hypothetical protein ACQEQG_02345 [Bacillota bacterium]
MSRFVRALQAGDLEVLRTVPKAEYHSHAGLAMPFSVFNRHYDNQVQPPPETMDGLAEMADYLDKETIKFLETKADIEFCLKASLEQAVQDGIVVLETSLDASFVSFYQEPEQYYETVTQLKKEYSDRLEFRPEIGAARPLPLEKWEDWVKPAIKSGVFNSFDLYDMENVNNLELYSEYYELAKAEGLKTKVHVGEFCGPDQIIETIEILEPEAIQHGIQAVHSREAMELVKAKDITLNICPTSNVKLGAVSSLQNHPAPRLWQEGIKITINTDDLMLFHSTLSEEYLKLYEAGLFTAEELDEIRKVSLDL